MPETAIYVLLFTPESMVCSGENKVDIVGVTGSIPVTPTIRSPCFQTHCAASRRRFTYFPVGSANLRRAS